MKMNGIENGYREGKVQSMNTSAMSRVIRDYPHEIFMNNF